MKRRGRLNTLFLVLCIVVTSVMTACAFSGSSVMPVNTQEIITVEPLAGVTGEVVTEVQQVAEDTRQYFIDSAALRLEKPVTIVLTKDRKAYIAEVISRFKMNEIEAQRLTNGTDALAGGKLIIVNVSGVPTIRQKTFLIAHELTHHYQHQIAGERAGQVKWMLEGMADTVGATLVDRRGYFKMQQYRENWQGGLREAAKKPSLNDLATNNDWSKSMAQYGSAFTYKTAGFAVLVLTEQFGQQKVLDYFKRLDKNEAPETAFKNVFGISMASFVEQVDRNLRKAA